MSRYGFALRGLPDHLKTEMAETRKRFHLKRFLRREGFNYDLGPEWDTDLLAYFARGVRRREYFPPR